MNDDELDRLIHRYFEQTLSPEEEGLLWNLIRVDKGAADRFVEHSEMESALVESLKAEEAAPPEVTVTIPGPRRRTQVLRPTTRRSIWPLFVAAGLILGFVALLTRSVEKPPAPEMARLTELPLDRRTAPAPFTKSAEPVAPRNTELPRRVEPPVMPVTPAIPEPRPAAVQKPVEDPPAQPKRQDKSETAQVDKPAPVTEALPPEAKIEKIEGDVVRVGDATGPVTAGQAILSGQGLEVRGAKSGAVIALVDGTRVELRSDTRLEKILLSAEQKRFVLTRGAATSTVAKQPAKMAVVFQTPHAEVTVIGTKLSVEIGSESTRVEVLEGRVRCMRLSDRAPVEVAAGRYSFVGKGAAPVARPTQVVRSFQDGVAPTADYAGTRDCWISSAEPNQNFATGNLLRLQRTAMSYTTLLRWDVASIPPGSRVISAELTFWVTGRLVGNCKVHNLVVPFEESEATWRLAAAGRLWRTLGALSDGDRGAKPVGLLAPPSTGFTTMSLNDLGVALVQDWINAPNLNCGLLIAGPDANEWNLDSRESVTPERRPKLTVTYIPGK